MFAVIRRVPFPVTEKVAPAVPKLLLELIEIVPLFSTVVVWELLVLLKVRPPVPFLTKVPGPEIRPEAVEVALFAPQVKVAPLSRNVVAAELVNEATS
jgi:hypothetical protein